MKKEVLTKKKRAGGSGAVIRNNFTCPKKLLDKVDDQVIAHIREGSGLKLTRSRLIQACFELMLDHYEAIDTEEIYDNSSLKKQLAKAICLG